MNVDLRNKSKNSKELLTNELCGHLHVFTHLAHLTQLQEGVDMVRAQIQHVLKKRKSQIVFIIIVLHNLFGRSLERHNKALAFMSRCYIIFFGFIVTEVCNVVCIKQTSTFL